MSSSQATRYKAPELLMTEQKRNIYVPNAQGNASASLHPYGYSEAHQHYESQRASLSLLAYRGVSPETITVMATLLYEMTGKPKGFLAFAHRKNKKFNLNIREGIPLVPTQIGSLELKKTVYDRLYPIFYEASDGYVINIDQLKLRIPGTWENLDRADPVKNAIYHHFQRKDRKGNTVFKGPGKNGFQVALVLSHLQWQAIEADMEFKKLQKADDDQRAPYHCAVNQRQQEPFGEPVQERDESCSDRIGRLTASVQWSNADRITTESLESQFSLENSPTTKRKRTISTTPVLPAKSIKRPATPPSRRQTEPPLERGWVSPDRHAMRAALKKQTDYHQVNFKHDSISGVLRCQTQVQLGSLGSLKSAHPGRLTLHTQPQGVTEMLGTTKDEFVVVKRTFYNRPDSGSQLLRFPVHEEIEAIGKEGNALYWATSLMNMVYHFIDNFVKETGPTETPVPHIPRTRFVKAGMAILYGANGTRFSAALLEEYIDEKQGDCRKFVHNANAIPTPRPDDHDSF
ncbi:hypothetical protein K439DRAFT_1622943 [Ramaria rubella]|nr:hypothetical protein K439DRAFT_1622943 [Ramaria rubella]